MKINARHKLIPAVAMLVVAAIALTSASYAWFTMSRTVKASGMELKAVAPSNLKISATNNSDASYAESITVKVDTGNYGLIPASSNDGLNFFAPDAIATALAGAPDLSTTTGTVFSAVTTALTAQTWSTTPDESAHKVGTAPSADGYYIDIPLWIATEGTTPTNVALSTAISTIEVKTAGDTSVANAARVAILTDALAAPAISGMTTANYLFSEAAPVYFDNCKPVTTAATGSNAFATTAATFLTHGDGNDAASTTNAILTVPAQTAGSVSLTGTNVHCIVRVWIEGNATECISTSAKDLTLTIGFKAIDYVEN